MSSASRGTPKEVLAAVFGFGGFRGLQEQAVAQVMAGGDALVLMPTGGGKSLCYQLPALCRDGLGLVVSPLIALMDDQVAALRQFGVRAAALHSELDEAEGANTRAALAADRLELLYVSPERLLAGSLLDRLARRTLSVIAIDEAHCVSAWGHEFRPEYRALACLPERLPGVPRIALTATADARTRADIVAALAMPDAAVLSASFHRPNLILEARAKDAELAQLDRLLARHPDSAGIVYCGSRDKTERVATGLRARGRNALAFHARLEPAAKRAALDRFRAGEPVVIVATIAFGMGVDRPDVRFVAHLDMPDSPEAYYQQIGRAGRDGLPAETLLLYGADDIVRARYWLEQSQAPEAEKRIMAARLEGMVALAETASCRTAVLLACFGEQFAAPCGHCDNCLSPAALRDATLAARKLLSAVLRTGERFGVAHLVDVVRGRSTEATRRHGHERLPTFGVGRDDGDERFWRGVARALLARGALRRDPEHQGLQFDGDARALLRGEATLTVRDDPAPPRGERFRGTAASASAAGTLSATDGPALSSADAPLFERLRAWRLDEARSQSVPPYVIFHDSVLRDLAERRPHDRSALAAVRGVGSSKLDRYGDAVLAVLRAAERVAAD